MKALIGYIATRADALERLVALGVIAIGVGLGWGFPWAAIVTGIGIIGFSLLPRRR